MATELFIDDLGFCVAKKHDFEKEAIFKTGCSGFCVTVCNIPRLVKYTGNF